MKCSSHPIYRLYTVVVICIILSNKHFGQMSSHEKRERKRAENWEVMSLQSRRKKTFFFFLGVPLLCFALLCSTSTSVFFCHFCFATEERKKGGCLIWTIYKDLSFRLSRWMRQVCRKSITVPSPFSPKGKVRFSFLMKFLKPCWS